MKLISSVLLMAMLTLFGCTSGSDKNGFEKIHSVFNKSDYAYILEGSSFNEKDKRSLISFLILAEKKYNNGQPVEVINIESYGPDLEIWKIKRFDGTEVVYHARSVNGTLKIDRQAG